MIVPDVSYEEAILLNTSSSSQATSIKMNGTVFKMLSSGLYSNKVRAVLRELCTNAWDAHIAAGNKADFDVWLPTLFKPQLRIRDYGTGMSRNTMFIVFNCLFESTKTDTNEQSGMMGLGSKSPFAYTNMMQVASYQKGLVNFYNLVLGKTGLPVLSHMGETSTDQPDGLEVTFSVSTGDFWVFEKEAAIVSRAFVRGPRPNFHGMKEQPAPLEELVPGVFYSPTSVDGVDLWALQGNVAYPWPYAYETQPVDFSQKELRPKQGAIYLEFPIGSLNFPPSREALNKDDFTQSALVKGTRPHRQALLDYYLVKYQDKLTAPELQQAYRTEVYPKLMLEAVEPYLEFPVAAVTGKKLEIQLNKKLGEALSVEAPGKRNRKVRLETYSGDDHRLVLDRFSERTEDTAIVLLDDRKYWRKKLGENSTYLQAEFAIIVDCCRVTETELADLASVQKCLPTIRLSELPEYVPDRSGPRVAGGARSRAYAWFNEVQVDLVISKVKVMSALKQLKELGVKHGDQVAVIQDTLDQRAWALKARKHKIIPDDMVIVAISSGKGKVIPTDSAKLDKLGGKPVDLGHLMSKWLKEQDWKSLAVGSLAAFRAENKLRPLFEGMSREEASNYYFAEKYLDISEAACHTLYDEFVDYYGPGNYLVPSLHDIASSTGKLRTELELFSPLVKMLMRRNEAGSFREEALQLLKKENVNNASAWCNPDNTNGFGNLRYGDWLS